jgi:hypothetical protein
MKQDDSWRFDCSSVTKYSPDSRMGQALPPLGSGWTHYSDVGKSFGGKVLDFETYLAVEDAYVESVQLFWDFHKVEEIVIRNLEVYYLRQAVSRTDDKLLIEYLISCPWHRNLNPYECKLMVRSILRNLVWCSLEDVSGKVQVRFGWDYYMYFIPAVKEPQLVQEIAGLGLFVG